MSSNILVCNLTRFGDLLQTQPLIDSLVQAGHDVSLLCLENFVSATGLMRNLSSVIPLRGSRLSAALARNWPTAAMELLEFSEEVRSGIKPDVLLNLTPTLPARLLTRLLRTRGTRILGFGMDSNGYGQNHGIWASFISMAARGREFAPFNLADMLRRVAYPVTHNLASDFILARPDTETLDWARQFVDSRLPPDFKARGFVCFQTGASEDRRRWPLEHFVETGRLLQKKLGLVPILLGSKSEEELGLQYEASARHIFINAIGQTSLKQLAALLLSARLLVTNDTGTMHLASGLGVPSLSFFLATAQPWDTGPELAGCCCIEPNLDCHPCEFNFVCETDNACRRAISPATVAGLANAWLETGIWKNGVTKTARDEARIWVTEKQDAGFFGLAPISGQENSSRSQWRFLLRSFWCQLLDDLDHIVSPPAADNLPKPRSPEIAKSLFQCGEVMSALIQNGRLLKTTPKRAGAFLKNCAFIQDILNAQPALAPIGAFWQEFQHNQGADLDFFLASLKSFENSLNWLGRQLS